jgi:Ni2+-binding GTPase involved in maturation of urease and hydrogenase
MDMFRRDVRAVNPKCSIIELDLISGAGVGEWLSFISAKIKEKRGYAG